eukprot:GEMP01012094.1.p1 GENE.GEMP01012094.1~~GEMP01012094.1.p1  ORF type:complete len:729 (+),score=191.77 GEMP01012094.1:392-2578(+)
MAAAVFSKLWDKVDLDKNGVLSVDELRAASKCLIDEGFPMGGVISSILKNADISKRGEIARSEWDRYIGYLNYTPAILCNIEDTVNKMLIGDVRATMEDLQSNIPLGWTAKRESKSKVLYENAEFGLAAASAEQTWENNLLKRPPEGFLRVPSRSRPGQFSYYSKALHLRVENVEQAWTLYNEIRTEQNLQNALGRDSKMTAATMLQLSGSVLYGNVGEERRERSKCSMQEDLPDPSDTGGRFIDPEFPPDLGSIGAVQEEDPSSRLRISLEQKKRIKWVRTPDLVRMTFPDATPIVFEDTVTPNALTQGQVGDCWLLASMAGLAEFPSMIMNLFVSSEIERGKYTIKLYDLSKDTWEFVTIDDSIPCTYEDDWSECVTRVNEKGHEVLVAPSPDYVPPQHWLPLFARLRGEAMWPLLLEKAVAKFCGNSYAKIAGGHESFAYIMFTGFPIVYVYQRPRESEYSTSAALGHWERGQSQYDPLLGPRKPICGYKKLEDERLRTDAAFFDKLADYDARNYLMGASITAFAQPKSMLGYFRKDGLVLGHAYSLVSAVHVEEVQADGIPKVWKMILLRNPHGAGKPSQPTEWQGDWSDGSDMWEKHPIVAAELNFAPFGDGMFWMQFEHFCRIFDRVHILAKAMEQPRAEEAFQRRSSSMFGVAIRGLDLKDHREDYDRMTVHIDPFQNCPKWVSKQGLMGLMKWYAEKGTLNDFLTMNPWMVERAKEANLV